MSVMPDPRIQQMGSQPQFPPPGMQGVPAQVLDPSAPGYDSQPQQPVYATQQVAQTQIEEYGDYYGFDIRHQFFFADGKQYIEFKVLNEGDLGKYQKLLRRDVVVEKATGDARIKIDQVEERHALLMTAITGWFLMRRNPAGQQVAITFSNSGPGSELAKWIQNANPAIIADLAEAIRRENPFLLGSTNETVEAIDKQIEQLYAERERMVAIQQGKSGSASS
jgi:hypothetical protein